MSKGHEVVKDMQYTWKFSRYKDIQNLYKGGATKQELISRFGKQNVTEALKHVIQ